MFVFLDSSLVGVVSIYIFEINCNIELLFVAAIKHIFHVICRSPTSEVDIDDSFLSFFFPLNGCTFCREEAQFKFIFGMAFMKSMLSALKVPSLLEASEVEMDRVMF